MAVNLGRAGVELKVLLHSHPRDLQLPAVVVDVVDAVGVLALEAAQPAPVVLGLDREALPLDPAVEARHLVLDLLDADARAEQARREDVAPVGEADLAVLDGVGPWLV